MQIIIITKIFAIITISITRRTVLSTTHISIGSASQGPYYVATFAEHLLVTRVGVRTSINRRIIDSVSFEIAILAGNNPYDGNKRSTLDAYLKIPPSVSRYEPQYIQSRVLNIRFCTRLMGPPFFFWVIPTYRVLPYSMICQKKKKKKKEREKFHPKGQGVELKRIPNKN